MFVDVVMTASSESQQKQPGCGPLTSPLPSAVGDIHGDLQKAVSLFKLAGCVEEVDRRLVWTGGNTTVVQLGDVLDRGSQEIGVCFDSGLAEHELCRLVAACQADLYLKAMAAALLSVDDAGVWRSRICLPVHGS